jgi:hypothetical protein
MASKEEILKEIGDELKAMMSWAIHLERETKRPVWRQLVGDYRNAPIRIFTGEMIQICRDINTQGRKLEWRYIRKLRSYKFHQNYATHVGTLSKGVSAARAAAQEIQSELEKLQNSLHPRKSIFNLFKSSRFDPQNPRELNLNPLHKTSAMLVSDLKDAEYSLQGLRDDEPLTVKAEERYAVKR